ncbi:MAG: hypothetical protein ABEJ28_02755 [Salinigranum sp.]
MRGERRCLGCGARLDTTEPGVYTHVRRVDDANDSELPGDFFLCESCLDDLDASVPRWDLGEEFGREIDGACAHSAADAGAGFVVEVTPTYVEPGRVSGSTHTFRFCEPCYGAFLAGVLGE